GHRRVHVVAAVVDGGIDAEDLARQRVRIAQRIAVVGTQLAGDDHAGTRGPAPVQRQVAELGLVLAIGHAAAVRGVAEGTGQQVGRRIDA
nr:hypothetical protein [Tanacetum cinerariifolium]